MNEGTFSPPAYNDLYNFRDGPQDDIFENSYDSIPVPSPNQTAIPKLRVSPPNSGVPVLPSSSYVISSTVTPPTISPSTSPCSLASSPTQSPAYPTPSPFSSSPPIPSIPLVTVTNTVFVTVFTSDPIPTPTAIPGLSSSTASPIPSPNPGDPGVITLNRRKPM